MSLPSLNHAPPDEDDDNGPTYRPGLVASITDGGRTIHRIDEELSFAWDTGSPDPRADGNAFRITWTGLLHIRKSDRYRFSAAVAGRIKLSINSRVILEGEIRPSDSQSSIESQPAALQSGWVDLRVGTQTIVLEFAKTGPRAKLALSWEGTAFERERIPAWALVHIPANSPPVRSARGEQLVRAHRCSACHMLPIAEPTLRAPDLTRLSNTVSPDWLIEYLQNPGKTKHGIRMPDFGLNPDEATAVATFLVSKSRPASLAKHDAGSSSDGKKLFDQLGCLACHTLGTAGLDGLYGGGDLSGIASKRPPQFFATWLKNPEKINSSRRMPVFPLEKKEVEDLSAYLATLGRPGLHQRKQSQAPADAIEHGRKLVVTRRCANCHKIGGIAPAPRLPLVTELRSVSPTGCQGEPDSARGRPGYRLGKAVREAMTEFISALPRRAAPTSLEANGSRLLLENNCTSCHPRGNRTGLRESVSRLGITDPKVQAGLVPPSLSGVGDKMHDAWLERAIAGEAPRLRPWMGPRMPRFPFDKVAVASLRRYFIEHDRNPDGRSKEPTKADSGAFLLAAPQLLGSKGFGCISCHAAGTHRPTGVESSALGPDLRFIDKRIRYSWFQRWTRDPARFLPGIEMPALLLAAPGLLGNDVERQRQALWVGLNSEHLDVPTVDTVRVIAARPKRDALILRDSIEHGRNGPTIRPFAVGLNNGHSFLLDLESLTVRKWWIGDFAQQKVRGKKWYWETAGVAIFDRAAGLPLIGINGQVLNDGRPLAWVENYSHHDNGVSLCVRLRDLEATIGLTARPETDGWSLRIETTDGRVRFEGASEVLATAVGSATVESKVLPHPAAGWAAELRFRSAASLPPQNVELRSGNATVQAKKLPVVPGYEVIRLPLDEEAMPTSFAWLPGGTFLASSLKGEILAVEDSDGDGLPDRYRRVSDYLSAPFGMRLNGRDLLVSHRHELLKLKGMDRSGVFRSSETFATGWGVSADYHDWVVGPERGADGNLYVALACQVDDRPPAQRLGRGKLLRILPSHRYEEVSAGLRFAMGLAANDKGALFASDNQGYTNPFNEINHLQPGRHYGFFNKNDSPSAAPSATPPAVQVPHPWTRSVNGITFVPAGARFGPFAGHMIGADITTRKLIRISLQKVGDTYQGAAYPFSLDDPALSARDETFLGPLAVAFGPDGCLYVGSVIDSGWGGGNNRGAIERVRFIGPVPFGIREVRARPGGFEIEFTQPADPDLAGRPEGYTLSCYRRVHQSGYDTPDRDRTQVNVKRVRVAGDRRTVFLDVEPLRPAFVYEIAVGAVSRGSTTPWPAIAYYTLHTVPAIEPASAENEGRR